MKKPCVAFAIVLLLLVSHTSKVHAELTVNHGEVFEFEGPDDLLLNPATVVIAVDVFGDEDTEVNGVEFLTDKDDAGLVESGGVEVETLATHSIDNWAEAPTYTGEDDESVFNLELIMQDIRWEASPAPVTVDITGLTAGTTYNLQLLFNEGADRNRRWDIEVEEELVVDDFSSEGEGVWTPENGFAYSGDFTLGDGELNVVMQDHIGGQDPNRADGNPILQAIILHVADGVPGDFSGNGILDLDDINQLNGESASRQNNAAFDLTGDNLVNADDVKEWAQVLKNTWLGDADLDGRFDSSDLVAVFQADKFEKDEDANWEQGDWDGDRRFGSSDLVAAFTADGYEKGARAAVNAVPEPSGVLLTLMSVVALLSVVRRRYGQ